MVRPAPKLKGRERINRAQAEVNKIAEATAKVPHDPSIILDTAKRIVYGRGEGDYGHPAQNFQEIADIWTVLLGRQLTDPITPLQVASMFVGTKLARLIQSPFHRDSMVDIAGYAETAARVAEHFSIGRDSAMGQMAGQCGGPCDAPAPKSVRY